MELFGSKPYFWAVICKNHWSHRGKNFLGGHTIPLAETDEFSPPPAFDSHFGVRCDECGKEHMYEPKELVRAELEPLDSFVAHPLFR